MTELEHKCLQGAPVAGEIQPKLLIFGKWLMTTLALPCPCLFADAQPSVKRSCLLCRENQGCAVHEEVEQKANRPQITS